MSFWTAIVLIVLIGSVASVLQARYRARHGIVTDMWGSEKPARIDESPELRRELADLTERVKVLERIVTDRRSDLATEIEALRQPATPLTARDTTSVS